MPSFGTASRKRRETLHPTLKILMDEAIKVMDFTIVCGFRDEEAQNKAFEDGASTKQWSNSKHNQVPSIAVDIAPWDPYMRNGKGGIDWQNINRFILLAGIVKGIAHTLEIPIRWGGDFDSDTFIKDQSFIDMPHIELVL